MSQPSPVGKARTRLAPSEKYEIYVQVLSGQATQREAADARKVDRSTVVSVCRTAKQGPLMPWLRRSRDGRVGPWSRLGSRRPGSRSSGCVPRGRRDRPP